MMRPKLLGTSLMALLLTCSSAAAQSDVEPPRKEPASVVVRIGDTAAPPEWHLSLPVAANVQPRAEVGRLALLVVYPAKVLSYGKVRGTETLKEAGFGVSTGKPTIRGDTASVLVEFTQRAKDPKSLPSGTLAILEFKVDKNAPQKPWPISAEEIRAWGPLPDARELTVAYKGPASFLVTPPGLPILSCFFYMH